MKYIILLSLLISIPAFADTYKATGSSKTNYAVAYYMAGEDIKNQFKSNNKIGLKYYSNIAIEEETINGTHIQYINDIKCNETILGKEITGLDGAKFNWSEDIMSCSTNYRKSNSSYVVDLTCTTNDSVIEELNKELQKKSSEVVYKCENHFTNIFTTGNEIEIQKGIIYGNMTYQEYYDKAGQFYKQPDGTYVGYSYRNVKNY